MVIISPGILSRAFISLETTFFFSFFRLWDVGRELEVPNLFVSLLEGISDSNLTTNGSRTVSLNVQKGSISVYFNNALVYHSCTIVSKVTRHHFTLEYFTREFTMSNGTRLSMCFTHTMSSSLTSEVPSLHSTSGTFTFGSALNVNKLSYSEVSRSKNVANR